VAHGREWAPGDRLVCRRNDYRPGLDVRNGTRGTVERADRGAGTLTLRADDGRRIELPADYLTHAHHGYALTGHASQGASVGRTFLLASPERGGAEWAYVAGSRHRIDLRVYAVAKEVEQAAHALASTWERRQAKRLAIERLGATERVAPPSGGEAPATVREAATTSATEPPIPAVALYAEREALAERLARGGPPSRANELRDLERELAAIERRRAELAALRERAVVRIEALGPLALLRSEGRLERQMLRADLNDFACQAERLDEREGPLLDSRAQARAGQEAHEAWRDGEARALAERIAALDAELSRRADERARVTERERPPYLEAALGLRPNQERPRARWREALRRLEGHRLRHGIGDPERPLGAEPADPAGRAAHRRTLAGLAEARAQIERADPGGRSPLRPAGHERRQLGPGAPGLGRDDGRATGRREGPSLDLGR
jgi:hypothetical protein